MGNITKIFAVGSLLLLSASQQLRAEWFFEAGPVYRGDMRMRVDGGSRAASSDARIENPGTTVQPLTGNVVIPDDGSTQILRIFEDGFVGPSGTPLFNGLGQTQFFGFESASQHNATAGTLQFTSTTNSQSRREQTRRQLNSTTSGWSDEKSLNGAGLQATTGFVLRRDERIEISLFGQVAWLGNLDAAFRGQNAFQQELNAETREITVDRVENRTFVFDTFGNPVFPSAPYAMSDPSGIGPLISDRPIDIQSSGASETRSEQGVGRSQIRAQSQVDLRTEADLYTFTLGPRVRWKLHERVSLLLQGGLTLNYLETDLRRSETFATEAGKLIGTWEDQRTDTQWLIGANASAGVQWDLNDRLYVNVTGGYDWVEEADMEIGPDKVNLDLSSYRMELALGWRWGEVGQ